MDYRKIMIDNYIKDNGFPDSKIISYKDNDFFEYYTLDKVPNDLKLADVIYKNENDELLYGFAKNTDGEEHRLITGYTGCGKTQRFAMQQIILSCKKGHSAIVTDMSGEIIEYCFDILKNMGVNVRVLNFNDTSKSDTFNPFLMEARKCKEAKEVTTSTQEFCESMAQILIHTNSTSGPEWTNGARSVGKGLMYGLFEEVADGNLEPEEVNLHNYINQYYWLRDKTMSNFKLANLSEMIYYRNKNRKNKSIQLISSIVENAERTRAGYLGIVNDNLSELNNDFIYDLTSSNTFEIEELWEKQTVLFINTGGKECGDIITGLLVDQIYDIAMEVSSKTINKKLPRPIQLYLDEFANISFADKKLKKMITTSRKMQIFFNIFIQSYTQLETKFGPSITTIIRDNCTDIFLGSKDYSTRELFASSCGKTTIETPESIYREKEISLITVPILTPEKLSKNKKGEMYIHRVGFDVIKTYFEAAYKCKEFIPSRNYEKYVNDNRIDYKDNVITQNFIVPKLPLKDWDKETLEAWFDEDEINVYKKLYTNNVCFNNDALRKFVRAGIVKKIRDNKYKPLLEYKLFDISQEKRKRFNWDF